MKFIFNDPPGNKHLSDNDLQTNQDFYNEPFNKMAGPPHR